MATGNAAEDPLLDPNNANIVSSNYHTYSHGGDNPKLAMAGKRVARQQRAKQSFRTQTTAGLLFGDSTLEAAMMHSIGSIGANERIDETGTLHLRISRNKTKNDKNDSKPNTLHLNSLFQPPPPSSSATKSTAATAAVVSNKINLVAGGGVEVGAVFDEEEEEYYDDIDDDEEDIIEGGSLTAAGFGIVKGTVGPAILYLPRGFQLAGYGVAIPALGFATFSYLYSARCLLSSWAVEHERNKEWAQKLSDVKKSLLQDTNSSLFEEHKPTLLSYPELGRRAFGQKYGAIIIEVGIAAMQFGVCLTYFIFVPQNLHESILQMFGYPIDKIYLLLAMVCIEIPMSWIVDIRKLTFTNVLATILIAFGLLSCLLMAIYNIQQISEQNDTTPFHTIQTRASQLPIFTPDTWVLFIGTAFFVFEGSITLLVPLQEAVYREQDQPKFQGVNETVTLYIMLFYIVFAMTCWTSFGKDVHTALTASLPPGMFATTVQLGYSIAVIFTFPLQAFPALQVTCQKLLPSSKSSATVYNDPNLLFQRNVLATVCVVVLAIVAVVAIDSLGNVVSLLGSLVGIPIALIYPPLMHNRLVLFKQKNTQNSHIVVMNYVVASIGVIAMCVTTYTTIITWDKGSEGE